MKFKICISILTAKTLVKQRSLNQIRHCLTGYNQISYYYFIKKYFNDL